MSSPNNNDDKPKKTKPSYFGKPMPANPKMMMDDHVEETTRRVGGRGAPGPSMFSPSMGPMPTSFNLSGTSMQAPAGFGASINTSQMKAAPQVAVQAPSIPKYVWNLHSVPTLPEFYPLDRSAVFVPHTQASTVAQRLSDVLRERSIEATYDNEKAKIKCFSNEGVDFRVRLYLGRNQYSHGIIVEVQRRFGDSLLFRSDTQAILDAAEGKVPMPPPSSMGALPMVSDDEDEYAPPPNGSSSLVMVSKMLSLPGFDAQHLGLQTLSSLVDAQKMGQATSRAVASELLKPNSEVGNKVFSYIVNNRSQDDSLVGLRVTALGILANAMKSFGSVPEFLREPLRPVLLKDLKSAELQPRTALMAAKCMEYFIEGDFDTMELYDVFETTLAVGQSRHANLMRQAERCMAQIR
jgi:hypothetical protein